MSDKTKQREIKFRFWSGSKMFYDLQNVMECLKQQMSFNGNGELLHQEREQSQTPDIKPAIPLPYDHVGLHGAAFLQFAGLHDKNGNEIYEGDICWTYEHGVGNLLRVVEFRDGSFVFTHPHALTTELRGWKTDYMEVKGDIYRNPELLQK